MPSTINGVGTWYYGKADVVVRPGICTSCRRGVNLESYDTTLFFVVLFIPVIPLGRKRIIDKCPACTRHQVAPLGKYQAARSEDIDEAVKAYCAEPENEQKACRAVAVAVHYRALESFQGVAALVEQSLPNSAEVHAMLGSAHRFFGHADSAEAAFKRALELGSDQACAEEYALLLLKQRRPAEAAAQLAHLFREPVRTKVPLLYYLVETYQALGQHRAAIEALDHWSGRLPELQQDKTFGRYRARSVRNMDSGKPLNPLGKQSNPWVVAVLVAVILGLIVLTAILVRS